LAGSNLPIPALFAVYPCPLAKAGLFGMLAAAAFSLIPLARARSTPPSALFRRAPRGSHAVEPGDPGRGLAGAGPGRPGRGHRPDATGRHDHDRRA
jgi:putative ABC transport system permease protein